MDDAQILRAHSVEHLARLNEPEDFDADTPFCENIAGYARASAAAALDALNAARNGENVFSLMRPPGHHATRDRAMGFCYLNNIAIAVLEAVAMGAKRAVTGNFEGTAALDAVHVLGRSHGMEGQGARGIRAAYNCDQAITFDKLPWVEAGHPTDHTFTQP